MASEKDQVRDFLKAKRFPRACLDRGISGGSIISIEREIQSRGFKQDALRF
jgi:hypothetical protein